MNTSSQCPEIPSCGEARSGVPEPRSEIPASCIRQSVPGAAGEPPTIERHTDDPHCLRDGAPLAFASYKVAIECYPRLLNRTLDEAAVLQRLRKLAPQSAFEIDYVARQVFKLINPRGHGANRARFSHETLGWFRQTYPEDAHLTAGMSLLLCAAKWWTSEQGRRSIQPRVNPLTTSHLDLKLRSFGFLSGERQAICRLLRPYPPRR